MNQTLLFLIKKYFSQNDLIELTYILGIEYDDLPAIGRSAKAIELIKMCYKQKKLGTLLVELQSMRPHVEWPLPTSPLTLPQLLENSQLQRQHFEPLVLPISAGKFTMGTDEDPLARPKHDVTLPPFFIGKYPVTNQEFAFYLQSTNQLPPKNNDWFMGQPTEEAKRKPVVGINWFQAAQYCEWLSNETGKKYRLPSEAEWEKAARGPKGNIYPWGNEWNKNAWPTSERERSDVNAYDAYASDYDCCYLVGTLQQWTKTIWGSKRLPCDYPYPYTVDSREELPRHSKSINLRMVIRGGIFSTPEESICARRANDIQVSATMYRGFRVVLEP